MTEFEARRCRRVVHVGASVAAVPVRDGFPLDLLYEEGSVAVDMLLSYMYDVSLARDSVLRGMHRVDNVFTTTVRGSILSRTHDSGTK